MSDRTKISHSQDSRGSRVPRPNTGMVQQHVLKPARADVWAAQSARPGNAFKVCPTTGSPHTAQSPYRQDGTQDKIQKDIYQNCASFHCTKDMTRKKVVHLCMDKPLLDTTAAVIVLCGCACIGTDDTGAGVWDVVVSYVVVSNVSQSNIPYCTFPAMIPFVWGGGGAPMAAA